MRALVTGGNGFIGRHLCAELTAGGYEVICSDINAAGDCERLDITNHADVAAALAACRPDVIFNLAGQANVGLSWKEPQLTVQLNTIGFINILESVKASGRKIRVIAMGSADVYGKLGKHGANVTEDMPLSPTNPYAVSKQVQEQFAVMYARCYGLDLCAVRQFNLAGAGQAKGYMISDFASGIAEIEAGQRAYLSVGNLENARDFTHVKDACRALRLIAEKGRAGEIYNICSGKAYKAQEILDRLIAMSPVPIEIRPDPARIRPSDTPVIFGSHAKLSADTGWEPQLTIDEILTDALEDWRSEINKRSENICG